MTHEKLTTPLEGRVRLLDQDEDHVAWLTVLNIICLSGEVDLMTTASSFGDVHFKRLVALRLTEELTTTATNLACLLDSPKRGRVDSSAPAAACRANTETTLAVDHIAREPDGTHASSVELHQRHLWATYIEVGDKHIPRVARLSPSDCAQTACPALGGRRRLAQVVQVAQAPPRRADHRHSAAFRRAGRRRPTIKRGCYASHCPNRLRCHCIAPGGHA